jgi:glycosyltransferase involved in cell wall biosynthesis
MRIAFVLNTLGMGGAERQVLAIAERMRRRGHSVILLILRPPLAEQWPTDLPVVHLQMVKSAGSFLAALANGRRFIREFHPQILHGHSFHANIMVRALNLLSSGTTAVSTVHNVYEGGWTRMLAYRLTNRLSRCTTVVSQVAADRFVRLKAISKSRCVVLTNGIDWAEFSPDPLRRARAREQMGVSGDEFVWLSAGRVADAKDYPNLLRAFAQLWAVHPNARLWVAGASTPEQLRELTKMAALRGVETVVRWLGLRRDMPALMDAADAFVLSSAWEGMPLVVGEAMAMEKLVVATDVGGVRELVGDAGLIVPAKNANALSAGLQQTMALSEDARCQLGRAARARIMEQFNIERKADEWEALYSTVLGLRDLPRS